MCSAFLITPLRRKIDFGANFAYAQQGSKPRSVVTLPRRPRLPWYLLCPRDISDFADFGINHRIHLSHPNEKDPGRAQARVFARRWTSANESGQSPEGPNGES